MTIIVDEHTSLEALQPEHAEALYLLADANRLHLQPWLGWVPRMQGQGFIEQFIQGALNRKDAGTELPCVIFHQGKMAGRIGIHKIDAQARSGEIGYWLGKDFEGKGIMTASCRSLVEEAFKRLGLHRIEIRCATQNSRSSTIPRQLGFRLEGTLRHAEWIQDRFVDLHLFACCADEWPYNR